MTAAIVTAAANLPWGVILENAPRFFEKATQLVQSVRKSKENIPVDVDLALPGEGAANAAKVEAAIKEIESSLVALNQQVTEASALIQGLAQTNQRLAATVATQRQALWALSAVTFLCLLLVGRLWFG